MRLARAFVALSLSLVALAYVAAPTGAASSGVRIGEAPELPEGASVAGTIAPERELDLYVALEPRDPAALERFAEEVATPGSPVYGKYLSVPQFAARFGPTPSQIATVRSALAARGLEVGAPSANGLSLPVAATVAEAEAAFAIPISRVETASGRIAFANRSAPQVAAAAAPYVQGVIGLDDLHELHRADGARNPLAPHAGGVTTDASPVTPAVAAPVPTGGPQPCTAALEYGEAHHGNTADRIANAYGLPAFYAAGDFGAGQTVALLELEPFFTEDIDAFQACYGTQVEVDTVTVGKPPVEMGEDGEAAMDIEQIASLAPGARVIVYQTKNDNGGEARILSAFVGEDTAKVMSSSWGICEHYQGGPELASVNTLLQEAAAQGQSFFVAAGDYGSTDCDEERGPGEDEELAVDFPGSDPFSTDVGGTRMEEPTGPATTDYLWNEMPSWGAGGGGRSEVFPMPGYQLGAAPGLGVVGALSSGAPCGLAVGYCRQVPDVSADAAVETGYVIHADRAWETNGGTSAAAPLWAAFAALTDALPACGGHPIGFANPALYAIGATAYAADFRDVTGPRPGGRPTTSRRSETDPFPAAPGYDMASGLGTPRGIALAASLCALANPVIPASGTGQATPTPSPPPPTATPTPAQVSHAHLRGARTGKPRLTFSLAAHEGATLTNLTLELPPALTVAQEKQVLAAAIVVRAENDQKLKFTATSTPGTIRIRLGSPQPAVNVKIGFPALASTPKLLAHIREGRTHKLGLVISTRESGGQGTRLPLTVGV
ncbi:MAG: S8/S53 family peptidase [Actinobacteria bacterium]|nr:S8/S53 family peptidase [Actinomycetota bacterium]